MAPPAMPLAFVIEDNGTGPRVAWFEETAPITIEEALRPQSAPGIDREQADERHECDGWLRSFLAQGLKSSNEVFKAGNGAGFSKDQIRRAKYRIGAVARKRRRRPRTLGGAGRWADEKFVLSGPWVPPSASRLAAGWHASPALRAPLPARRGEGKERQGLSSEHDRRDKPSPLPRRERDREGDCPKRRIPATITEGIQQRTGTIPFLVPGLERSAPALKHRVRLKLARR